MISGAESPWIAVTRLTSPASSTVKAAGSANRVISVRFQPMMSGTSAAYGDAIGENGCWGRTTGSITGEKLSINPAVMPPALASVGKKAARIFSVGIF